MNKQRGFTLIECIVALLIFSIIFLLVSQGLHSILRNRNILLQHSKQLSELQKTLQDFNKNIPDIVSSPLFTQQKKIPIFSGSAQEITFNTSEKYIHYVVKNHQLIRETLEFNKQHQLSQSQHILLTHIEKITFQFLNQHHQFVSNWIIKEDPHSKILLPSAIRVIIDFDHTHSFNMIFRVGTNENIH